MSLKNSNAVLVLEDGTTSKPLTGNHLIWCENRNCYVRVDELSNEDSLLFV